MEWKIESRQKSVAGVGGHNYLALVSPDGRIHKQIHGHLGPNRRLIYTKTLANPEVDGAARPVVSGSEDEVHQIWKRMEESADELDGRAGVRPALPKQQFVLGTVLRRSGFNLKDSEPNSSLRTPGTGVDLSNPLWWTPEHRWPGVPVPADDESAALPADRLP